MTAASRSRGTAPSAGQLRARRCPRPAAPPSARRPARARRRRCAAVRSRCCASPGATACSPPNYARLLAALGVAEAALARAAAAPTGSRFVCPGVTFEIGRDARVRLGRWSWIGHGTKIRAHEGEVADRRQDRARPGVHDLRLPARLDRARVHRRRPRDADRLRPRRRRGRAPDPRCRASTSATCASATTSGSATAPASCAA